MSEILPGHHWSYIGRVSGMSQSRWCHGQSDRNLKITVNLANLGRNVKTLVLKTLGLKNCIEGFKYKAGIRNNSWRYCTEDYAFALAIALEKLLLEGDERGPFRTDWVLRNIRIIRLLGQNNIFIFLLTKKLLSQSKRKKAHETHNLNIK